VSVTQIFRDFRLWVDSKIRDTKRGHRDGAGWIENIPNQKYPDWLYRKSSSGDPPSPEDVFRRYVSSSGDPPSPEDVFRRYVERFLANEPPGMSEILTLPPRRVESKSFSQEPRKKSRFF